MTRLSSCLFIVIFIAVPVCVSGYTSCPDIWVAYNGSCYLFGHGQQATFVESEHYCNQHGGNLVHVENVHEENFLKDYMTRLVAGNSYWVGLTSELVSTEWLWYDTQTLPDVTDWYPGEPNQSTVYKCAMFYYPYQYKWVDYTCSGKAEPVCKQRGNSDTGFFGK